MVVNLNKISDNLSAENTLKTIGAEKISTPGSARKGIWVVNAFLNRVGIDTTKYFMVDGSGVSHYNLLHADMFVELLKYMYKDKAVFPLFYASLPIAGQDGSLRGRMRGTKAERHLHATTGSIRGVSSLSGYVTTADGEMLVFSMLMQNFIGSNRPYRDAQDKIGAFLAGFSRKITKK
jgi:PBP4 family serine-type D-alanyl-D-alanine carboxypeptidase